MLKRLFIKNFVLIETNTIEFEPGLNILTGESGAGKTALIDALALVLGMRADTSLIRKGEEKAILEATFTTTPRINALLDEAGIASDDELAVRRELSQTGKNRAFINDELAPLPLLEQIGTHLIDLFSQHSHQRLRQTATHRTLLDLFGNLNSDLTNYQKTFHKLKETDQQITTLTVSLATRERDLSYHTHVVQEIEGAALKEGEDDALFEEYSRLTNSSELQESLSSLILEISESPNSHLSRLHFWQTRLQMLTRYDKSLENSVTQLNEAATLLSETARDLSSTLSDCESDPLRLDLLQNRLDLIDRLKKKYGKTLPDIEQTRLASQAKIDHYTTLDEKLAALTAQNAALEKTLQTQAHALTAKRTAAASHLAPLVTDLLHTLNMDGAAFTISLTPTDPTTFGQDDIHFYLKANAGENPAPVATRTSGGELSRLMLAITTLLAEKNQTPTLIFDEIDSNIGGETATKIGATLASLGTKRQVICITHFPQVARHAHAHFRIHKQELSGRTIALCHKLDPSGKEAELTRMMGGSLTPSFSDT